MVDYRASRARRRSRKLQGAVSNILLLSKLMKLALFGLIAGVVLVPLLFLWYSRDLPTPGKLVYSKYNDSTRIYDRKGVLLYSVYQEQNRTYVKLSEIPKSLRSATIAIEDRDFYQNKGFSVIGYIRAVFNMLLGKGLAGGSTITQQLVKNVLLTSERNIPRKIKEFILSIQVENKFSKDQILEMYLNNIGYGGTAIGAEAAAETYFGKKAKDLDVAETAFLAGLPQSPTAYSPFSGNKFYIGRTKSVLKQMVEEKYITKDQSEKALQKITDYQFSQKNASFKAPHFVLYVKQKLAEQFGDQFVETGGLQVTTSLDYDIQQETEKIIKEEVDKLVPFKASNGAAIVTNPKTGEILAMVGSKDYFDDKNDGNFNVAVLGKRQPGSSLKPVVYAAAFEKGYTASTMVMDVKTEFQIDPEKPPYIPVNYDGKFRGPVQLRFALGNSLNVPSVKLLALTGIKESMQKGYDMGILTWQPTDETLKNVGLSLVLGGRETTLKDEVTAYGTIANKGKRQDLISILEVKDSKGKKLFEYKKKDGERALSEEVAFIISHILLDNNARADAFGTNSLLRISGKTVAVKTGTTDEKRDNWAVGFTPSFVVGVWVGNNDNSPMNPKIASGITGASPIWRRITQLVLKNKPDEQFEVPNNVAAVQVDSLGGGLPIDGQPTRTEYFVKGTEPTTKSNIYQREFIYFHENDPVSTDGVNRWQQGIDKWIDQIHKGDSKYYPPEDIKHKDNNPDPTPTETPTPGPATETPTPAPVTDTPTPTLTPSPSP